MLRLHLMVMTLFLAAPVHSQSLRQFHAETSTPLSEVIAALESRVPEMVSRTGADAATVTYSGNRPPPALISFLKTSFSELPPNTIAAGKTFSMSLTLYGEDTGTALALMLLGDFPASDFKMPPKSLMMMEGGSRAACTGQIVALHPATAEDTAQVYREHMEADGFSFPDADPQEASFFIGQAPGCTVAMYLQPDQHTTMVVIRYLEE